MSEQNKSQLLSVDNEAYLKLLKGVILQRSLVKGFFPHLDKHEREQLMESLAIREKTHIAIPPLFYNGVTHIVVAMKYVDFLEEYHGYFVPYAEREKFCDFFVAFIEKSCLITPNLSNKTILGLNSAVSYASCSDECQYMTYQNMDYPHLFRLEINIPQHLTMSGQVLTEELWFPCKPIYDLIPLEQPEECETILLKAIDLTTCVGIIEGREMICANQDYGVVYSSLHCGCCGKGLHGMEKFLPDSEGSSVTIGVYSTQEILEKAHIGEIIHIHHAARLPEELILKAKEYIVDLFPDYAPAVHSKFYWNR